MATEVSHVFDLRVPSKVRAGRLADYVTKAAHRGFLDEALDCLNRNTSRIRIVSDGEKMYYEGFCVAWSRHACKYIVHEYEHGGHRAPARRRQIA